MPESLTQDVLARYKEIKRLKEPWLDLWQLLGEYIHVRKQEFTTEYEVGDFLNRELFDASAPRAAKIAASSILSMLWPQSVRRFRLVPPNELTRAKANKEYYEFVTETIMGVLDNPKGGLPTALSEYMLDQMVFGTSGIEVQRHPDTLVFYRPWGVKHMSIDEDMVGGVDTVYIEQELPVHKVVKEYGIDNVSEKIREAFNGNRFDRMAKILIAIEPRVITSDKKGNRGMPFRSVHIEIEAKHTLREKGFSEMPIKVCRFNKLLSEKYGRSFGMDALPDALESNAIWESVTVAIEKNLDPPLGVMDDGRLGGGEIDTSAGAINVFNSAGRPGEREPVFPLFTVGEIKQTVNLLERLEESIGNHFSIDRLLDFNNETQMTLGEAQLRNRLRNATLSSIFVRQISELFNPLIERTFNLLLEQGALGVVEGSADHELNPDAQVIPGDIARRMVDGQDVYKIEYFSPAMRIMQSEEAEGIIRTWEMLGNIAGVAPGVVDNMDEDESIRRFRQIVGGPSEIERAEEDVDEIRDAREEAAKAQQEREALLQATEGARNIGQSNLIPQITSGGTS